MKDPSEPGSGSQRPEEQLDKVMSLSMSEMAQIHGMAK